MSLRFSKAGEMSQSTILSRIALVLSAIRCPPTHLPANLPKVLAAVRRRFSHCSSSTGDAPSATAFWRRSAFHRQEPAKYRWARPLNDVAISRWPASVDLRFALDCLRYSQWCRRLISGKLPEVLIAYVGRRLANDIAIFNRPKRAVFEAGTDHLGHHFALCKIKYQPVVYLNLLCSSVVVRDGPTLFCLRGKVQFRETTNGTWLTSVWFYERKELWTNSTGSLLITECSSPQ